LIFTTFKEAMSGLKAGANNKSTLRTEQDLSMKVVLFGILAIVIFIGTSKQGMGIWFIRTPCTSSNSYEACC
jgi:uncharacterized oligopeptide transporter (OPT) family protein